MSERRSYGQDCLNSRQAMENSNRTRQDLTISFINETSRHVFITGKAGTGKTTLLREIKGQIRKKMVVAAPTGRGGDQRWRSDAPPRFLSCSNELILPILDKSLPYKTSATLLDGFSLPADKEKLLLDLEVLIIDEVSMMRADILDAIDHVLRHVRSNPDAFGGVQVVYFGDLYQLPPVASPQEEAELLKHYRSFFFFDAKVMATQPSPRFIYPRAD